MSGIYQAYLAKKAADTERAEPHPATPYAMAAGLLGGAFAGYKLGVPYQQHNPGSLMSRAERAAFGSSMGAAAALPVALYLNSRVQQQQQQQQQKTAADEGIDPILQHPNLAAKPRGLDELSDRKKRLHMGISLGGVGGVIAGAGLAHGAAKYVASRSPDFAAALAHAHPAHLPITGGLIGLSAGAALGAGAVGLSNYVDKVKRHHAAAQHYEAQTGTALPMDVRHPYLTKVAPTAVGLAAGALAGHVMGRGLTDPMERYSAKLLGSAVGSMVGGVATPGVAALAQDRRDHIFRGRVSQKALADSVLDEDTLNTEAMK